MQKDEFKKLNDDLEMNMKEIDAVKQLIKQISLLNSCVYSLIRVMLKRAASVSNDITEPNTRQP